ncbi:murein hydrolase activator EnvC family protein [Leptospira interrogans]|uniref:M23 family metallopeptidase n=1 Tax=Leptospira interrogans serovar Bataviae TaxID=312175 RepID=A0AAP9WNS9_LEPIR|nr:M23 family metallopeptidase [Leptospira interrogans]QOI53125.1 M23 family metallopeptidase [Leptospira interrogans serovar Bataviae]WOT13192.1 M23 family metallopeptidase [Leptospira interrogans]
MKKYLILMLLLFVQVGQINSSDDNYSVELDGLWKLNIESENSYKDKNYSPLYLRFLTNKNNDKYALILNSAYADFIATDLSVSCDELYICTIKNSKNSELLRFFVRNPKTIEIKYSLSDGENPLVELGSQFVRMDDHFRELYGSVVPIAKDTTGSIYSRGLRMKVEKSSNILTVSDGVIVFIDRSSKGYGGIVMVDHGSGVKSIYGPLDSIEVKEGDKVSKGQVLGRVGTSAKWPISNAQVLYYIIFSNSKYNHPFDATAQLEDPLKFDWRKVEQKKK